MKIKQKLLTLISFYNLTRGVGHTKTMINGIIDNSSGVIVVAANLDIAEGIQREILVEMGTQIEREKNAPFSYRRGNVQMADLNHLDRALIGNSRPLALDNSALLELFIHSYDYIETLEREVRRLNHENEMLKGSTVTYRAPDEQ